MRTYLTSLALVQFRSHRNTQLDFDGRPVAIYGPNGAGKTNLIEAISLLSPGRGLRRAASQDLARRPEQLGWRIAYGLESFDRTHEIDMRAESAETSRQLRIDGKPARQTALGQLSRVLWLVPALDRLWTEGAEGRRRFLDRIALSFEPRHAEAAITYEKAMRDRNRLLREHAADDRWYAALEGRMAEAGAEIARNRRYALSRLTAAQQGASTSFPVAELAMTEETSDLESPDALREAFAASRSSDLAAGRTLVGPHRSDLSAVYAAKNMAASQCSTGEQKALLISLILANARALAEDTGAPPILLLDEVAAHLDEDRRAALFDEICTLGSQAFLTGTGAELFVVLGDRAQHLQVREADGASSVTTAD